MNQRKISTMLNQAICALQGVAAELDRNECQCRQNQSVAQHRARIAAENARRAAQMEAERARCLCECEAVFTPAFAPIAVPVAVPAPAHRPVCPPKPAWGVAGEPKQDPNKVFGINVRVDEPVRSDFRTNWEFQKAHAKFDRLVDAAEACDWQNKSNTAPLHKVNAIRRRVEDGPVMGLNLIGESRFWD